MEVTKGIGMTHEVPVYLVQTYDPEHIVTIPPNHRRAISGLRTRLPASQLVAGDPLVVQEHDFTVVTVEVMDDGQLRFQLG